MAVISSKDTLKSLKRKGFVEKQSHHRFLELWHNGKFILHTRLSQGGEHDLNNFLIKQMSVQCKLDKAQFLDLVRCPLSKEDYFHILESKGFLK